MNALTRGRAEDEDVEAGLGEFHPFSPEIAEAQFPPDFKEPRLKDYDGTTDPQVHVTVFKTQMLKKEVGDALQCKMFSGTLTGSAMIWYSNLPPLSINDTQDFLKKFLAQFSAQRSRKMTSGKLFCVRQKAGRKKDTFNSANYNSRQGRGFNGNDERFKSRYQGSWSTDRSREVDLTPLNASRTRILKDVYQSDLLKLPPPAEGAKGPNLNKWCDYHRAKGHDTEN
ncbi:hypothetical protein SESBI_46735 [Sesbania bispinosa]|nr:hypothetical protein SESBI_46735 [Sesbania bispinosa]